MSELDSPEVIRIVEAARRFVMHYETATSPTRAHGMAKARTLASLANLEAAVDEHVSRETSELEAKLDGQTEEPPF